MCGGKGAKACTANSAHERLMQQEQLSSIVSLQISSVPHCTTRFVSSKRAREGENGVSTNQNEMRERQISRCILHQLCVGLVLFLLFETVVGVWFGLGLIINYGTTQIQIAVCT